MTPDRKAGRGHGPKSDDHSGPGELTGEDAAVWEHAARSVQRMQHRRGRLPRTAHVELQLKPAKAVPADRPVPATGKAVKAAKQPQAVPVQAKRQAAPPVLIGPDRKTTRRIGSGRIEIDARLDLHGMTQGEAHGRLRGFLKKAQADGCRWVLVITGKGAPAGREGDAGGGFGFGGGSGRGILRRVVPQWLEEPDLRAIVVGFRPALTQHGGDGALYVQLRRGR